jgi:hypothetical protein
VIDAERGHARARDLVQARIAHVVEQGLAVFRQLEQGQGGAGPGSRSRELREMALQLGVQDVQVARQLGGGIAGRHRQQAGGDRFGGLASVAMSAHTIQYGQACMALAPTRQPAALGLLALQPDCLAARVDQHEVVLVFLAQARPDAQPRGGGHVECAEAQGGSEVEAFGNLHSRTLTVNSKKPSDD